MRPIQRLALLQLVLPAVLGAQSPGPTPVRAIDWPAIERDGVTLLREYLRVNSTNPPGNELTAARFLRDFLAKEGIEAQILDTAELGAGRANLYARVKGNGRSGRSRSCTTRMSSPPQPARGLRRPSRASSGTATSTAGARST